MSTLTAPHNYKQAYVDRLHSSSPDGGYRRYHSAKLGVIDNIDCWEMVRRILAGIKALSRNSRNHVQPIVRVELVWDKKTFGRRGILFFDNTSKLQLHVIHALFGYSGSGAAVSWDILEALGVSPKTIQAADDAVGHDSYTLVFSREQIGVVEGVETALPLRQRGRVAVVAGVVQGAAPAEQSAGFRFLCSCDYSKF